MDGSLTSQDSDDDCNKNQEQGLEAGGCPVEEHRKNPR